jgi:hypothetical protein
MSKNGQPDKLALLIAEEVLRTIYGDDFIGCRVTPDQIAGVIAEALKNERAQTQELIELYEKVVEAVHLLSTPPENQAFDDPKQVRTLLSERLDGIHAVTTRTMQTTAAAKRKAQS